MSQPLFSSSRRPSVGSSHWLQYGLRKDRWKYLTCSLSLMPCIALLPWRRLSTSRTRQQVSSVFQDTWLKVLRLIGHPQCQVGKTWKCQQLLTKCFTISLKTVQTDNVSMTAPGNCDINQSPQDFAGLCCECCNQKLQEFFQKVAMKVAGYSVITSWEKDVFHFCV